MSDTSLERGASKDGCESPLDDREPVVLAAHTTLGVGGPAQRFACVREIGELIELCRTARSEGSTLRILGGGSNVVIADEGTGDDWIVKLALTGIEVEDDANRSSPRSPNESGVRLRVGAGERWDDLVEVSVDAGWAGLECLSGIPGSVGAAPIQNVGAYGQEVSETLESVTVLDLVRGEPKRLSAAECGFSYRQSSFKRDASGRYAVLAATFHLHPGGAPSVRYRELQDELAASHGVPSLRDVRAAVLAIRARKSMVLDPADENRRSCGSFFLNPVVTPALAAEVQRRAANLSRTAMPRYPQLDGTVKLSAAWLIEQAGFRRGDRRGAVGLSTRHALAIVAHEGARGRDVVALAWEVRNGVAERFGIRLVPEPVFWGWELLEDGLPVL